MKPGDLIFWSATYNDPTKKPRKHDMVHVEIFMGGENPQSKFANASHSEPDAVRRCSVPRSVHPLTVHPCALKGARLHRLAPQCTLLTVHPCTLKGVTSYPPSTQCI